MALGDYPGQPAQTPPTTGATGQQQQQQIPQAGNSDWIKYLLGGLGIGGIGLGSLFGGSSGGFKQQPNISPEQMATQDIVRQLGLQGLTNPGQSPIAQQARHNFNTQTIPSIAERFTAMGGGQRSGAFQAALRNAGEGFNQALASLDYQQALPLLNLGLRPQFDTAHTPNQPNQLVELLTKVLPLLIGLI